MADIRFDGKVAIVTGAGGGLGRQHALELARRGAKVVVNDLGGSVDGSGGGSEAANKVVEEIKALGGEAIANGSSVTDDAGVALMVKHAMDAWGRIDILIANAGVLRDKSFSKMEIADFEFVLDVHLLGTVKPAKAVWEIMKEQNYGRIVCTTSSSGLYGNFGQTNYGAAKLGIIGFMNTLKLEGQKNNIHVNAIAPVAATRMTENLMPPEILERLKPRVRDAGRGVPLLGRSPHRLHPDRRRRRLRALAHRRDRGRLPGRRRPLGRGSPRQLGEDHRPGRPAGLRHRRRAEREVLPQDAGRLSPGAGGPGRPRPNVITRNPLAPTQVIARNLGAASVRQRRSPRRRQ